MDGDEVYRKSLDPLEEAAIEENRVLILLNILGSEFHFTCQPDFEGKAGSVAWTKVEGGAKFLRSKGCGCGWVLSEGKNPDATCAYIQHDMI